LVILPLPSSPNHSSQSPLVLKLGSQLASVGIGARYYVEGPANGPEWGIRLFVTLMFSEH
jgi:hypothetical protein